MNTDEIIRAFLELGSPFIADGAQRAGLPERIADPTLRPLLPDRRVAGTVVTFHLSFLPTPQPPIALAYDRAFTAAKDAPSPILVVQSDLGRRSPIGGGASRSFLHAGLRGVVIDGTIRDVADVRAQGFPLFSRGISTDSFVVSRLPEGYVGAETGGPVVIGGVTVLPGDLVVADEDGIVFCRLEDATAVLAAAWEILAEEEAVFRRWDAGESYLAGQDLG